MEKKMISKLKQDIDKYKIIAILRGLKKSEIENTVHALYSGGIRLLEITFDQKSISCIEDTSSCIEIARRLNLQGLHIGAGTVMTTAQVAAAKGAGAEYILSPNLDIEVLKSAKQLDMLTMPGCLTPSEISQAYNEGADYVKVFPAHQMGCSYFKELQGPIGHIPLLAVGGVDLNNMLDFLAAGAYGVGIGTNIVNLTDIQSGNYNSISKRAKEYTKLINL